MTPNDRIPLMARTGWLDWEALAADYGRYHAARGNRLCHMIGIPLIVLCVVRWTQPAGSFFPLAALALPLYVAWDTVLGLWAAGAVLAMAAIALFLSPAATWALFVLGWVFQFVGHAFYERKSPAFARNLRHLLVGPMWILRELRAGA